MGYKVVIKSQNGAYTRLINTEGDDAYINVDQLIPDTLYIVDVCAFTSVGVGPCIRSFNKTLVSGMLSLKIISFCFLLYIFCFELYNLIIYDTVKLKTLKCPSLLISSKFYCVTAPSVAPENATCWNKTSPNKITIAYDPVPMDFIHGILKGYRIEYRAIKIGFEWKSNYPLQHVMVSPFYIKTTIRNLSPNTVYEIQVMAVNEHGIGAKSQIFYGGNLFLLVAAIKNRWIP